MFEIFNAQCERSEKHSVEVSIIQNLFKRYWNVHFWDFYPLVAHFIFNMEKHFRNFRYINCFLLSTLFNIRTKAKSFVIGFWEKSFCSAQNFSRNDKMKLSMDETWLFCRVKFLQNCPSFLWMKNEEKLNFSEKYSEQIAAIAEETKTKFVFTSQTVLDFISQTILLFLLFLQKLFSVCGTLEANLVKRWIWNAGWKLF